MDTDATVVDDINNKTSYFNNQTIFKFEKFKYKNENCSKELN